MKSQTPKTIEPQKFQAGETVLILRPHLWSNTVGEVVSFKDGQHRIRIPTKHEMAVEPFWHTDAPASQLESFI